MRVNANLPTTNLRPNNHIIIHLFVNSTSSYGMPTACEDIDLIYWGTEMKGIVHDLHTSEKGYISQGILTYKLSV